MRAITTYMVTEGQVGRDGEMLPKYIVSETYDKLEDAKRVKEQCGEGFYVFKQTAFDYSDEVES